MIDQEERKVVCVRHGEFQSIKYFIGCDRWSSCPVCAKEEQEARKAAEQAEKEAAEEERMRREWQDKVEASQIPYRFQNRTLETYVASTDGQKRALSFAKSYVDDFDAVYKTGRSVIFVGKPGTGKTHLATGVALHVMRAGFSAIYTTAMRAIRRVKDTWGAARTETEAQAIDAFVAPNLLILDEVGVQFGSDTERLILFDIMNGRYEQRLPTILLSNLSADELTGFLGERVIDRLREDGGEVVVFDWQSHRRSPAS